MEDVINAQNLEQTTENVRLNPLPHLMRAVWLQALRRNEIYVIAILLGLYAAGALVLRTVGIGSAQTARFITDLGLRLGAMLASLLVILMGARQLALELELRTIYPVLAKPVTRAQVLMGKALPTWLAGVAALALFTAATLALTPRLPYQHAGVLAQTFLIEAAALAMLAALVFWLALWLPPGVPLLVAGALYFGGGAAANWTVQLAGGAGWARALANLIPDFGLLSQFDRYVSGGAAHSALVFGGYLLYTILWTGLFSTLALQRFRRMAL